MSRFVALDSAQLIDKIYVRVMSFQAVMMAASFILGLVITTLLVSPASLQVSAGSLLSLFAGVASGAIALLIAGGYIHRRGHVVWVGSDIYQAWLNDIRKYGFAGTDREGRKELEKRSDFLRSHRLGQRSILIMITLSDIAAEAANWRSSSAR